MFLKANRSKTDYWSQHAMEYFSSVKKKIDDAVNYRGRGNSGRFTGTFPTEFKGIVSSSKDAIGHFPIRSGVLKMADFCKHCQNFQPSSK